MTLPAAPATTWPSLPDAPWDDTLATLHLWTQIAGKIRLAQTPWVNHGWHVALYVTTRGLTTSPIPYGTRTFQIDFDLVFHQMLLQTSDGRTVGFALDAQPIAAFYARVMESLRRLDVHVTIHPRPNELPDPVRFDEDARPRVYDREHATRFWQILVEADRVLKRFRARFTGKCSPVHFFWGAADLAVTRFSGRPAPVHPGGVPNLPDRVTREAYSHEVSSAGFWGGGNGTPPAFYSYAYPEPAGFAAASVSPADAFYSSELREFVLPYEIVQRAASPDDTLLQFLQSTYEAAADLGRWDRTALERAEGAPRDER
jgi:hypothetical protein